MLCSKLNLECGHCESATISAPIPLLYADIDIAYSCALAASDAAARQEAREFGMALDSEIANRRRSHGM